MNTLQTRTKLTFESLFDHTQENIPVGCKLPPCQPFNENAFVLDMGCLGPLYSEAPCLEGKGWAWVSPYGEVQCIMDNGHMGPLPL